MNVEPFSIVTFRMVHISFWFVSLLAPARAVVIVDDTDKTDAGAACLSTLNPDLREASRLSAAKADEP
jgi:hypothetical protein